MGCGNFRLPSLSVVDNTTSEKVTTIPGRGPSIPLARDSYLLIHLMKILMQLRPISIQLMTWLVRGLGINNFGVRVAFDFGDEVDDVHSEAGDAFIEPEAQDVMNGFSDGRVAPVEIRLLGGEEA